MIFTAIDLTIIFSISQDGASRARHLLVTAATEAKNNLPARPYSEILFLPSRNFSQEKWTGPKLGPENPEAARITGFDKVDVLDNLRTTLVDLMIKPRTAVYTDIPAQGEISNSTVPLQWLKTANAFPIGTSFRDVRPRTFVAAHV